MEYFFADDEEEDTGEVFEDPAKDPKDETVTEVPPEFEDSDDEDEEDPFEEPDTEEE